MKVSASLPTGVTALFFESAQHRRELEESLVERLKSFDYAEVILPVIDYLEPYEKMSGLVRRRDLYRFVERGGEVLALRGDFTPMLARLLAPRLRSLELPLRFFYRGDVLRYQEARAGRQRELYQIGIETLGLPSDEAELEVLTRFLDLLQTTSRGTGAPADSAPTHGKQTSDAPRWSVVIGFAGALDALCRQSADTIDPAELIQAMTRRQRAAVRPGPEALLEVVTEGVPATPDGLGDPQAAKRLHQITELRDTLAERYPEIEMRIDLAEFADQIVDDDLAEELGVHAYYDGLIFRAFDRDGSVPVGGGGRYNRLFRELGAEVTAAGFSISLDHLVRA